MLTLKLMFFIALCHLNNGENIFLGKLNKLLDYCLDNQEQVDSGVLLGIAFAKNQLSVDKGNYKTLILLKKCEKLENKFDGSNEIVGRSFFNTSLIKMKNPSTFGRILRSQNVFPSTQIYLKLLNDARNLPNGQFSDQCLSQLLDKCEISDFCWTIENENAVAFGYAQTHKLLFHLLNNLACNAENFSKISQKICSSIYQETKFIFKTMTIPEFKDLAMEQIFLCAFSGYKEFMKNSWIAQINSWQMSSGCFSYDGASCSTHMNGLGIASLAFFGKTLDDEY